jgi:hypothetical protein
MTNLIACERLHINSVTMTVTGCWVKEGWDELFIFLCDMLLK